MARPADPRFELGAVLSRREHGPAQPFASVIGHDMPLVGNVMHSRSRIAALLGTDEAAPPDVILKALASPIRPCPAGRRDPMAL